MWKVRTDGIRYGVCRVHVDGTIEIHYPGFTIADESTAQRLAAELNEAEEHEEHAD